MKNKFPRSEALKVARALCLLMADKCVRLVCAGSLRRGKAEVGDVELVYIPDFETVRDGLFDTRRENLVDRLLIGLLERGELAKRRNVNGSEMWGDKNKLAVHVQSGIPVDLFSTVERCWFNYLVCRTGGAATNTRIAAAAQDKGWKWNPYGPGFTDHRGDLVPVTCEEDVFRLVGLPYLKPEQRD